MTWWMEHLILNIAVFLLLWSYVEGDSKRALALYLVVAMSFYTFLGAFVYLITKGGHIPL